LAYDYSNPNHDEDFVPQNVPMKPGEEVLHHYIFKSPL
jgi:cytochrome c oxidase subunit 1